MLRGEVMPVPQIKTEIIDNKIFSKTLSKNIAWRLIYDELGEVTHLFESTGITLTPGMMKCFVTNTEAGVEIEDKSLKCFKAIIYNEKVVESITEQKVSTVIPLKANEKIFYTAGLIEFEMYAQENKLNTSKVKDILNADMNFK